jgi:dTDP-4-dehydrorhamnose 3,5-epimerase
MNTLPTKIPGVLLFEPKVHGDARGFFMETWQARRYREAGIGEDFVQDNLSRSRRGVLRGLHMQHPHPQGKLISVLEGEVFDVVVDIRLGSPTFGQWISATLNADNRRQVYVPPGLLHGFVVTSDTALFAYKCTDFYNSQAELTVLWNDPTLAIDWPVRDPILATKDLSGLRFTDLPRDKLVRYG